MNLWEYIDGYLAEKVGETDYQLWKYDAASGKTEPLKEQGDLQRVPICDWQKPGYYITKHADIVDFHFYYPERIGIVIRMIQQGKAVEDGVMEHLYFSLRSIVLESMLETKKLEQEVIIESMHSITSSLDLNHVLKTIIKHALNVIPAADAGYLMLYDPTRHILVPKAPVGFSETISKFEVKVGESITGKVFEDGRGRIFNSFEEIIEAMHANRVRPENLSTILQSSNDVEMRLRA